MRSVALFRMQYSPLFEIWFAIYPRKEAKRAAYKAYLQAQKRGFSHEELIEGVKRYAELRKSEPAKFTRLPATWLNSDCVLDQPLLTPKPSFEMPNRYANRKAFKASDQDNPEASKTLKPVSEVLAKFGRG